MFFVEKKFQLHNLNILLEKKNFNKIMKKIMNMIEISL